MKKALIVLLALVVITGGVFAQAPTFTGRVLTGMFIKFGESYDDPIVVADDDDTNDAINSRFQVTYDAGKWGVQIGQRAGYNATESGYWFIYNAHGWFKFLDNIITLRAGKIDPAVWETGGWVDTNLLFKNGLRLEVTPISGLSVGAMFSYPNDGGYAGKIANFFQETLVGFSYNPGTFKVSAQAKMYSKETRADTDLDITAQFGFYGISRLNLLAEFLGLGLIDDGTFADPNLAFGLDADFQLLDPLKIGAQAGFILRDGFKYFMVKPFAEFKLTDPLTLGAEVKVEMGEEADRIALNSESAKLSHIKPAVWLRYNTTPDAWMKVGYGMNYMTKDYGDGIDNYIKLIFAFNF